MFHVKRATGAHRTCKDVGHRKGAGLQPPAGGTINHNPPREPAPGQSPAAPHTMSMPCNCAGRVCLGMPPSHPSPTADAPSAVRDLFACRAPRSNREGRTPGHVGSHPKPGGPHRRHRIPRPRVAEVAPSRSNRPSAVLSVLDALGQTRRSARDEDTAAPSPPLRRESSAPARRMQPVPPATAETSAA